MRAKTLAEFKNRDSDRDKVIKWLDRIRESDLNCRKEVLDQCEEDKEARKYYVSRYEENENARTI